MFAKTKVTTPNEPSETSEIDQFLAIPGVVEAIRTTREEDEWVEELELALQATKKLLPTYFLDGGEGFAKVEARLKPEEVEWLDEFFLEDIIEWLAEKADFAEYESEVDDQYGMYTITVTFKPDYSDVYRTDHGHLEYLD